MVKESEKEKYLKLLLLCENAPILFQKTVEKIEADKFLLNVLCEFLQDKDPFVRDGTRRILLTHFSAELSNQTIKDFLSISGDSFVQNKATALLEERYVIENDIFAQAKEVIALFT